MPEFTFFLTDVESSTALWEQFPDEVFAGLARHRQIIATTVAAHGGMLVRERGEGDSTFSVFTSPLDALAAAAEIGRALTSETWPARAPIRVRAALYTGDAEPRDGDYFGTSVNRAARLRSLAFAGQILVGSKTAEHVAGALPPRAALVDLGPRPLRDLSVPEHVFELRLTDAGEIPEPLSDAGASNVAWVHRHASGHLVGRERELQEIADAWRAACAGGRVLVTISGEPGIGKTTLAAHAAARAVADGGLALVGGWDEDAGAPYQAFRDALAAYASACPRSILRADLRDRGDDIRRLFPDVADLIEAGSTSLHAGAEAERYRLFEALEVWLRAIASRRPVIFVADDMHWADRASLLLLQHIVRSARPARLLVLATYRDTDPDVGEVSRALPALYRLPETRRIALEGLRSDEVLQLFERATTERVRRRAQTVAEELHAETAGNPFFLSEIIRHLDALGALDTALGSRPIAVPDSVRGLVHWRFDQLSDEVFESLSIASVIGQEFDFEVLAEACGTGDDKLLDALDAAGRAGLVREHAPGRYGFSHAVVRRTLLDDLSGARRVRVHRRIGEALEHLGHATAAELARHFGAAAALGVAPKAVSYAREAGARAAEELAFEAAVGHYGDALALAGEHLADDAALRCEILLALGAAHDRAGEYGLRDERFVEASGVASSLGRTDLYTRAALGYGGVLPAAAEPDDQGHALLTEALDRLGDGDSRERALVLSRLAHWLHFAAPRSRRIELADEAVAIARRLGDRRDLAAVLTDRIWALDGPDDLDDQIALAEEISDIGRELGIDAIVLDAVRARADALFERGDIGALRASVAELERLADELRIPEYIRISGAWRAVFAGIEGRFAEAEEIARDVHDQLRSMGHPQAEVIYFAQLFPLNWLSGRLVHGIEFAEAMITAQPSRPLWTAVAAWSNAEAGRYDRARDILETVNPGTIDRLDKNFMWWPTVVGFTVAANLLSDTERAAALYDVLLPYGDRLVSVGSSSFLGAAALHLGQLASTLGRYDDGAVHFETATVLHTRLKARPWHALTDQCYARLLFAAGDHEAARVRQDLAQRTARELGLVAIESRGLDALNV